MSEVPDVDFVELFLLCFISCWTYVVVSVIIVSVVCVFSYLCVYLCGVYWTSWSGGKGMEW